MKFIHPIFILFTVSTFFSPLLYADIIKCPELLPDGTVNITNPTPTPWKVIAEVTDHYTGIADGKDKVDTAKYTYIESTGLWPNTEDNSKNPLVIKSGAFTDAKSLAFLSGGLQQITLRCEGNYSATQKQPGGFLGLGENDKTVNGILTAELTVTYETCTLQQDPLEFICNP